MNLFTIRTRSIGRKLGIHTINAKMRNFYRNLIGKRKEYETKFHNASIKAIRSGDTVWDVGANIGFYTELFLNCVGPEGKVIAFEPNPLAFAQIQNRMHENQSVTLMQLALGSSQKTASFVINPNYSPNAHIQYENNVDEGSRLLIPVQISTGDLICKSLACIPNVIKIDVEGFEDDVLLGLENTLTSPLLRTVLIEIHFNVLEERGRATAPIEMEQMLKRKGFKLSWVDISHLVATRA